MTKTVLILGASGRFGSNCVIAFEAAGWTVRKFTRGTDMAKAVQGVDVIVNGLNPPYQLDWQALLPPMAQEIVAAARSSGATILQPGNVYGYGNQAGVWDQNTPHHATTTKGKARIAMEAVYRNSDVQTIILRGGDFIDTKPGGNYFDLMTAKLSKGRFEYPGNPDIPHAWAFLPDMARAAVMLAQMRSTLGRYEDIPFAGFTLSGKQMMGALQTASGQKLTMKGFPWWFMRMGAPVSKLFRALLEMRYLWDTPHSLNGARLAELLPDFEGTDIEVALKQAVG